MSSDLEIGGICRREYIGAMLMGTPFLSSGLFLKIPNKTALAQLWANLALFIKEMAKFDFRAPQKIKSHPKSHEFGPGNGGDL